MLAPVRAEHVDDPPDRALVAVEPIRAVGCRVGVRVPRDPVGALDRKLGAAVQMARVREAVRRRVAPLDPRRCDLIRSRWFGRDDDGWDQREARWVFEKGEGRPPSASEERPSGGRRSTRARPRRRARCASGSGACARPSLRSGGGARRRARSRRGRTGAARALRSAARAQARCSTARRRRTTPLPASNPSAWDFARRAACPPPEPTG